MRRAFQDAQCASTDPEQSECTTGEFTEVRNGVQFGIGRTRHKYVIEQKSA